MAQRSRDAAAGHPAPVGVARAGVELSLGGVVVLVTGASSGIGKAIALACARAGADVGGASQATRAGAADTAATARGLGRRTAARDVGVAEAGDGAAPAP